MTVRSLEQDTPDPVASAEAAFDLTVDAAGKAVSTTPVDTLADLMTAVSSAARGAGLTAVPAVLQMAVDAGASVLLDPAHTSLDELIAAAVASGSALLFVQASTFDAPCASATLTAPGLPAAASMERLLPEIERIDGWTRSLDVAFAHHGVLVIWPTATPWSEVLDELLDVARDLAEAAQEQADTTADGDEYTRLDEAAVTALATRLLTLPTFRRGARPPEREAAARELPEIALLCQHRRGRSDVFAVLREAEELLQAEVAATLGRLADSRHDLVALLAEDPEFRAIRTAEARARFGQDWILAHTSGLRMPTWWVRELVAATKTSPRQLSL